MRILERTHFSADALTSLQGMLCVSVCINICACVRILERALELQCRCADGSAGNVV